MGAGYLRPLLWRSSGLIPDLSTPTVLYRRSVGAQVNVCTPNCNPLETLVIAAFRGFLPLIHGLCGFCRRLLRQIGGLNGGQGDGVDDVVDQSAA